MDQLDSLIRQGIVPPVAAEVAGNLDRQIEAINSERFDPGKRAELIAGKTEEARLEELNRKRNPAVKAASTAALNAVRSQFADWRRENPTAAARLRQIKDQRAAREGAIRRSVQTALNFGTFNVRRRVG